MPRRSRAQFTTMYSSNNFVINFDLQTAFVIGNETFEEDKPKFNFEIVAWGKLDLVGDCFCIDVLWNVISVFFFL